MKLPVIPGHEFSGRVTELGEGAKNHHKVDVGDLVVSEQIISCDKCRFCNQGQYQVQTLLLYRVIPSNTGFLKPTTALKFYITRFFHNVRKIR